MKIRRFKPKHKRNSLIWKVMVAVGAIMAASLILAGSIMITQSILPQETEFEAPPPVQQKELEPEKQKRKVITKNVQKRSQSLVKRINVVQPQQINTPQVEITLPTGMGGDGTGGGIGLNDFTGMTNLGEMKIELPDMEIFGTKAKSDRVFIAFDASPYMMSEDMGALESYNIVRDEIKKLIKMLPSTCVFNVMAFDVWFKDARDMCFKNLVPASNANKATFDRWISVINKDTQRVGLFDYRDRQYEMKYPSPPSTVGQKDEKGEDFRFAWDGQYKSEVYDRYRIYQTAIEQGAGAIWILTHRWPAPSDYMMPITPDQMRRNTEEWERNLKKAKSQGKHIRTKEDWDNWGRAWAPLAEKAKEWVRKDNERRKARGIPQRVVLDYRWFAEHELKMKGPECQGTPADHFRPDIRPKVKRYNNLTLLAAYEPILKKVYDERGLKRPTVNIIILLTRKDEWNTKKNAVPKSWAFRNGKGTVRILRGGKPVSEYEMPAQKKKEKQIK